MSAMMQKMSESNVGQDANPKKGDCFQCKACGMEIEVTKDCKCREGKHAHFECCGAEMSKC